MASYYVHFIDDDPVLVYGPYSLSSAKDFARIGSQPGKTGGGRRAVFTGPTPSSRLVRVYEEGDRMWPRTIEGLSALEPAEAPRVLAPKVRHVKPESSGQPAMLANPGRHYTVSVVEVHNGVWLAEASGEGTQYLPTAQRDVEGRSAHEALRRLAHRWDKAGFGE